jgi:hypothetical protein
MQDIVRGIKAYYPILREEQPLLSVDALLQRIRTNFVPYLGETRVLSSLSLPVDYLAFLLVVEGTLADTTDTSILYGPQSMLHVTEGDLKLFSEPSDALRRQKRESSR